MIGRNASKKVSDSCLPTQEGTSPRANGSLPPLDWAQRGAGRGGWGSGEESGRDRHASRAVVGGDASGARKSLVRRWCPWGVGWTRDCVWGRAGPNGSTTPTSPLCNLHSFTFFFNLLSFSKCKFHILRIEKVYITCLLDPRNYKTGDSIP